MKINLTRGCICDNLSIDGIKEVDMTDEQKTQYFNEIVSKLPKIEPGWFNYFLQWLCEEYGVYGCCDKRCECCGDLVEWYDLEI